MSIVIKSVSSVTATCVTPIGIVTVLSTPVILHGTLNQIYRSKMTTTAISMTTVSMYLAIWIVGEE